jgi:NADPH2 dehydrogenase
MAGASDIVKLTGLKSVDAFRDRLATLGLDLPVEDAIQTAEQGSPLAQPATILNRTIGNRWCIQPMEGWDGTRDGRPSELTLRRWEHFGRSGAKLIWGGEAVAVRHDGRANPNQLCATPQSKAGLAKLRETLLAAHKQTTGRTDDLLIGLQLTHSGRFCRPNEKATPEPRILYHHPLLDARVGIAADDDGPLLSDDDIDRLTDDFLVAARLAADVGYDFVDIKACHGYLGHEFLGAHRRPGKYGGGFENRTRFLREVVERIQQEVPSLGIGVRVSVFDTLPYEDDPATRRGNKKGVGRPMGYDGPRPVPYGFNVDPDGTLLPDLGEAFDLLAMLRDLQVPLVNITCGSPYYDPHIQRPALYPPSDGYQPPEDPLIGVARQVHATRRLKERFGELFLVGSGYTYLQEFLPLVAQAVLRAGWVDGVGLGRMVLSYPELPWDCLTRGEMQTKRICRTFSDCTSGPRNGLVSGCYPLDPATLRKVKAGAD